MQSERTERGEMSQDSGAPRLHPEVVSPRATTTGRRTIDPAARRGKRAFDTLSASSVGLELGVSVIIGVVFGYWLDLQLGTSPWMMLLFLVFGFAAGFRGVLRAVKRADRAAMSEMNEVGHG